jgi:hypothetical protein
MIRARAKFVVFDLNSKEWWRYPRMALAKIEPLIIVKPILHLAYLSRERARNIGSKVAISTGEILWQMINLY